MSDDKAWRDSTQKLMLELEVERKQRAILTEKANSLARLVEQLAYAPVAGYYQQQGNDAPLRLLRLAVEDIDRLIGKGK